MPQKTRLFISFDFDHDEDLRNLLAGQAKHEDSPFEFTDASVKEPMTGDWKEKVRGRIKRADQVAVICGEHTDTATGVSTELSIAQEEGISYFLLKGRSDKNCVRPKSAKSTDKMYSWTWPYLKLLIAGKR